LDELGPEDKDIVILGIKNFICDTVKGVKDEDKANPLFEKTVQEFMKTINDTTDRLSKSRFALTQQS
jgi:hypothetical protein